MQNIETEIRDLFQFMFNNPQNEQRIVAIFETLEEKLVEKIKLATEIDLTGFVVEMDNYGIKHAIEGHGNNEREIKRGQIGLTISDFERIPLILQTFDVVRYDFRGTIEKHNLRESIVFEKQFDNQYLMAMELRRVTKKGKQNRLVFQTMYIKKLSIP